MKLLPTALFMVLSIIAAGILTSVGLETVQLWVSETLYWMGR